MRRDINIRQVQIGRSCALLPKEAQHKRQKSFHQAYRIGKMRQVREERPPRRQVREDWQGDRKKPEKERDPAEEASKRRL